MYYRNLGFFQVLWKIIYLKRKAFFGVMGHA